jgi:hypothetical protein
MFVMAGLWLHTFPHARSGLSGPAHRRRCHYVSEPASTMLVRDSNSNSCKVDDRGRKIFSDPCNGSENTMRSPPWLVLGRQTVTLTKSPPRVLAASPAPCRSLPLAMGGPVQRHAVRLITLFVNPGRAMSEMQLSTVPYVHIQRCKSVLPEVHAASHRLLIRCKSSPKHSLCANHASLAP